MKKSKQKSAGTNETTKRKKKPQYKEAEWQNMLSKV